MRKKYLKGAVALMMTASLLWSLPVFAQEETLEEVKGYHQVTASETESEDTWYAVGRGKYLQSSSCKVSDGGNGKVNISGSTNAGQICDRVYLRLYLDYSKDQGKTYSIAGYWDFEKKNSNAVIGAANGNPTTKGYYYAARGVHSVTEGNVTEGTDTSSGAIEM